MTFVLPDLPYAIDALAPHLSADTLNFHYGKHHAGYVGKLNGMVEATDFEGKTLEDIMRATAGDMDAQGIFNNAAQIWNHTFYWYSMSPSGGGQPSGALFDKINEDFGSFDAFVDAFTAAGGAQFGSGWAWLVLRDGKLAVERTANADCPLTDGATPLLTMDVWEHAYYLDYQNRRPDYIETFLKHLVNWNFAADNYAAA